jgi:MFS family permease
VEFSPSGSQWVLNAYALVFGGLLLVFGRLGDRMGHRRLFIVGLIVFLAAPPRHGVVGWRRKLGVPVCSALPR